MFPKYLQTYYGIFIDIQSVNDNILPRFSPLLNIWPHSPVIYSRASNSSQSLMSFIPSLFPAYSSQHCPFFPEHINALSQSQKNNK